MTDDLKAPETDDIKLRLRGRAAHLYDRGEIKSPSIMIEAADRIATLEAALADMTQQRDAAMAGAVKVKPLVWNDDPSSCLDCITHDTFGLYQITDEFVLFAGHSTTGDKFFSLEAAKSAAQADYEARIMSALTPDPDRMLALTAAAEAQAEARGWNKAMLTAITHVAEIRNAHTPGPIFKALNEAMGKIDDARFAGLLRYQTDATEAAAKGGV